MPDIGKKLADKANRVGVAARLPEPAVPKSSDVDLALIDDDAQLLRDLELAMVTTATPHDANPLYLLQTAPGIGKIRSLVRLDELHDSTRVPRGQAFGSYCRLVQGAKASAGKRSGTSATQLGHASLTWAFSDAAVLCLRNHPAGQQSLARVESKHGTGKALTVLAHTRARAVSDMFKRGTAVDMDQLLRGSGSGAGAPTAERGHHGVSLTIVLGKEPPPASAHAQQHLGTLP